MKCSITLLNIISSNFSPENTLSQISINQSTSLKEPEDACYLAAQTQDIQPNIAEMLRLLKNKLPFKDVDWLIEICDNVFSGEKFDDIMFNNVIEHFIQKKIKQ